MGSLAEFPDMVRSTFLNEETNDEGIYNIRFYVRGKPWVVSVDDYMFMVNSFGGDPSLLYMFQSRDGYSIWGAMLEKAWAKVRGNYLNADEGGIDVNGIRALTGLPVFTYRVD